MSIDSIDDTLNEETSSEEELEENTTKAANAKYDKSFLVAGGLLSFATFSYSRVHDVAVHIYGLKNTQPMLQYVKENYAFSELLQNPYLANPIEYALPATVSLILCIAALTYDKELHKITKKKKILNAPIGLFALYACALATMSAATVHAYQIAQLIQ